jgi:ubiquinone/menaquinone biosynthesis C-methylase UbiE
VAAARTDASGQQLHQELFTSGAYVPMFRPDAPQNPFARLYDKKREAVIAAVPGRDLRLLDVGGGMGRMAIPLSARHFVTLTDLSPQMLDLARPYAGPRLNFKVADACALPFPDASFDAVVCIDVVPHLLEPQQAMAEARRVLRPGGRIVIDSSNALPLWTLGYPRYLGRNPRRWIQTWRSGGVQPEWRARVWHRRKSEFLGMLTRAGFTLESVEGFGPFWCPKWHLASARAS